MEDRWSTPKLVQLAALVLDSHRRWTGRELCERQGDPLAQARSLYAAPCVVLAHDGAADPCFTYANATAQALWELDWDAFIGMPSRLSAEPVEREQRAR
ncbi:MAG: MEKHLA domain-containing protein, partial [Planctomycetes bacterium]|nr:MEKHLA domain-containing protein [Planctomycetota bacterium]